MIRPYPLLTCLWMLAAAGSLAKSPPNVLMLCIDDLRPELRCYGVDYIESPQIDKLASAGRVFLGNYVQAPTCGASRYAMFTGRYGPADNGALFSLAKKIQAGDPSIPPSLPAHFRANGYTTVSVGKVSHNPGGRGGPDWDDEAIPEMPGSWDRHLLPAGPWKHPRGAMHGLANGEIRTGKMAVFQSTPGPDTIYPDGLITNEALAQLQLLAKDARDSAKPFFLAVGIIRPHLPFGAPAKYMEPYQNAVLPPIPHPEKPQGLSTWHVSGEFMRYQRWGKDPRTDPDFATEVRRHYAACVSYADAQVGRVLDSLDTLGLRENTIIVLWGDHGWHLGEHSIWGKHSLFEESLRSPLIISHPGIKSPGKPTPAIVETIDVFPTLCELAGLTPPEKLHGRSLLPQLEDPSSPGHPAISYSEENLTIRTDTHRLIVHHEDGKMLGFELYDHRGGDGETTNLADGNPELVRKLNEQLKARLGH